MGFCHDKFCHDKFCHDKQQLNTGNSRLERIVTWDRRAKISMAVLEVFFTAILLYSFLHGKTIFGQEIPLSFKVMCAGVTGLLIGIDTCVTLARIFFAHKSPDSENFSEGNLKIPENALGNCQTNQDLVAYSRNFFKEDMILDPNLEPLGLLYKVKNVSNQTIGYLFGSLDCWDLQWKALNTKVLSKLEKATDVYFTHDPTSKPIPWMSVDFEIKDLSQSKKQVFMETSDQVNSLSADYSALVRQDALLDPTQLIDDLKKILKEWTAGNEVFLKNYFDSHCQKFSQEPRKSVFEKTFGNRNRAWFSDVFEPQLLKASKQSKFFACVGYFHLFDTGSSRSGLKSLFEDKGFTLVQVCESKD